LLSYVDQCVQAWRKCESLLIQSDVSTGSKVGFLTALQDTLENMQFDTRRTRPRGSRRPILPRFPSTFRDREILYQMSLSVAAKLMGMSLLDYIS
jgi:hypothetical protein